MKITLNVQISESSLGYVDMKDLKDPAKLLPHLSFSQHDFTSMGYVNVGSVEIDVELLPPDQIIGNAIVALRAKAADVRAKAVAEATQLEGKAQQLLAIENKPTEKNNMAYNFNQDLSTDKWDIKIDTAANYGYTERHSDGTGNGLWFAPREGHPGQVELIDFDGTSMLAKSVIAALRSAGYHLDETFD